MEEFDVRNLVEIIRHIALVFVADLIVAILILHHSPMALIKNALAHDNPANIFCAIVVFSVPVYLICMILDAFDEMRLTKELDPNGKGNGFVYAFFTRLIYDLTYLFTHFKRAIIPFLILAAISVFGLLVLLK